MQPAHDLTAVQQSTAHRDLETPKPTSKAVNGATPTPQTPAATPTPEPDPRSSHPLHQPSGQGSKPKSIRPILHPSTKAATDNPRTELDPVLQPHLTAPAVHIGHHVLSDGGPATTIEGKAVAIAGGTIYVDGTAMTTLGVNDPIVPTTIIAAGLNFLVEPSSKPRNDLPVPIIGDTVIPANEASQFVNEGQTLTDNNAGITISGTMTSLHGSRTKAATGTSIEPWFIGSIIMNGFGNPSLTSLVTIDGITFSIEKSQAIVSGTTFTLGPTQPSSTLVVGSQTFILGPNYISARASLSSFTADGLTFSMGESQAIISGTTYSLGPTQFSSTLVIDGRTFILGPNGLSAKATLSPYIASGLTFSMDATEAIISGTTFSIGPGARPTTVVLGNEIVSLGPGGVGLASTIVALPNATSSSLKYFTGQASTISATSNKFLSVSLICVLVIIAIL